MVTDVSVQPVCPVFKGQAVQKVDFFNLEDATDILSRSTDKYQSVLRNIPEVRRFDLHCRGRLKSHLIWSGVNICLVLYKTSCTVQAVEVITGNGKGWTE
jgi:hypothetical protein